ncbi:MAG: aminotransferase class I/II-fold pyridoxal phosphate-dependent enzyme [Planctomycetota bacterium]|nr:aminotransferase class I/II-fold pyridoxal phosphate-dependent enzyme [Planctomycetota bacterium]
MSAPRKPKISAKAARFTESVIREMTRLCNQHGGVNLAQGFPDFPAPAAMKDAAKAAIDGEKNQYAITWGAKSFRDALVAKTKRFTGLSIDPERELTVTCGSTEAMMAALLATLDPGDEVIVFEPFYENYGPDCILSGASPVYVKLRPPDWSFDREELRRAFGPKTKGIIVNTPHNPTGKVYSREELEFIGQLAIEHDALIYTDEIYEHIVYDGRAHVYPFALPGLRERTVAISGLSKTYSATGWRIGWAIAPPEITAAVRKVHDFLTVGAPHPLQEGGATALAFDDAYYAKLATDYTHRRALLVGMLKDAGFTVFVPQGAYYIMTEYPVPNPAGIENDDVAFAKYLVEKIGVAVVPGSSFYRPGAPEGKKIVRFNYSKRDETLKEAGKRLLKLK